jgi:hypothetical protein
MCSELTLLVLLHAAHSPGLSSVVQTLITMSRDSSATEPVTDDHAF